MINISNAINWNESTISTEFHNSSLQMVLDVLVSRRCSLEAEVVVEVVEWLGGDAVHVDRVVAHEVLL